MVKSKKCEILVINQIAQVGLKRFPAERYAVVKESKDPWAILVRSQDLHQYEFGPSLRAVGRAGAGVNNIPVTALSKRGSLVADAAIRLGMNVLGHDPHITVEAAWSLPSQVRRAHAIDEVLKASDFVSLHVPLVEKTRHMINAKNIEHLREGAVLL